VHTKVPELGSTRRVCNMIRRDAAKEEPKALFKLLGSLAQIFARLLYLQLVAEYHSMAMAAASTTSSIDLCHPEEEYFIIFGVWVVYSFGVTWRQQSSPSHPANFTAIWFYAFSALLLSMQHRLAS
jgi:hypothetical protein